VRYLTRSACQAFVFPPIKKMPMMMKAISPMD